MFARSREPFFSSRSVKDALAEFADSKHWVIFCGAGVTIDQTGLGWEAMLARAFDGDPQLLSSMRSVADFPQIATALSGQSQPVDCSGSGYDWGLVAGQLKEFLYPAVGERWEIGGMVDSLTYLVLVAATVGKSVTVITTNYDDHLKRSLEDQARRMTDGPLIKVSSELPDFEQPTFESGTVEFFFLHGRIPESGAPSRHRVVNEIDYAQSRFQSVEFLRQVLSAPEAAVLILGSSLTDPPLIDSLALTRSVASTRVALYALEPSGLASNACCVEIVECLTSRARLLGLNLLTPDFLCQIPQFLTELSQAVAYPEGSAAFLASNARYGRRLERWWEEFSASKSTQELHDTVRETMASLLAYLDPADDECLRLDLWVRETPRERRLTLIASTAGPFTNERLLKRQSLRLGTKHATMRSFLAGRPRLLGLKHDLGWPSELDARWHSFLVVPVQARVDSILTPIGAVTLSSDKELSAACMTRLSAADRESVLALLGTILEPSEDAVAGF